MYQVGTPIINEQTNRWQITQHTFVTPTTGEKFIQLGIACGYDDGETLSWGRTFSHTITGTDLATLLAAAPSGADNEEVMMNMLYDYAQSQEWIPSSAIEV